MSPDRKVPLFRGSPVQPIKRSPDDPDLTAVYYSLLPTVQKLQRAQYTSQLIAGFRGEEALRIWTQAARFAKVQRFTDDESIAREIAGRQGFVEQIEVPEEIAEKHRDGKGITKPGEKVFNRFVFLGRELSTNAEIWNHQVIPLKEI